MQWERPQELFARTALTHSGWQQDVHIRIDAAGIISDITSGVKAKGAAFDVLLPGMADVHSHAFQRAMAGLTEAASGAGKDNFWSWRRVMYSFLASLTPEQIEIIAHALYIELLKQGYTSVGEFHYLHHDSNGKPYADPAELSHRIAAGAKAAGVHLALLPVLYQMANFGGVKAEEGQKRFIHSTENYLVLLATLVKRYGTDADVTLGVAPHSLRAVTPDALQEVVNALPGLGLAECPIHIHAAEQEKEVADSVAWSGERPVAWLLNHCNIDARWCLIHSTHTTPQEIKGLAESGAVAGLCPTTEANLGDGIFAAEAFLQAGGRFGIGTDSNMCTSPWEELRLLEYSQRLSLRKRTVLHGDAALSTSRTVFSKAAAGGAQALGMKAGAIAVGSRADLVALSLDHPLLAGKQGDQILDALIFAVQPAPVTDVLVAGRQVVKAGKHPNEENSRDAFRAVMQTLQQGLA